MIWQPKKSNIIFIALIEHNSIISLLVTVISGSATLSFFNTIVAINLRLARFHRRSIRIGHAVTITAWRRSSRRVTLMSRQPLDRIEKDATCTSQAEAEITTARARAPVLTLTRLVFAEHVAAASLAREEHSHSLPNVTLPEHKRDREQRLKVNPK